MVIGNNNVKECTKVHSTLVLSLRKVNNMLGKQITVGHSWAIDRIKLAYKFHEDHYEIHYGHYDKIHRP
jgi:hypothetical protein